MVTRTIPVIFPKVRNEELFSRKLLKASLIRRMAQGHNWIWSKFVRVYANTASEGLGNALFHYGTNYYNNADVIIPTPDGGADGLPLCCFAVPPNWGLSKTLKVQGRLNLATGSTSTADVFATLYDLDDVYAGAYATTRISATGNTDFSLTLQVPQNKMYQIKVILRFNDASSAAENVTTEQAYVTFVSARYQAASAAEIGGETPQATWSAIADEAFTTDYPIHAGILQRLNLNINHLMCYRGPELCQSWLGNNYHNTSTFTEIGRYIVYLPDMITEIKGKLQVWCTHGGAGNEIRILVGGVVKETFTALAAGETTLTLAAIGSLTSNSEHTITIEAKSTAASADWGTICNLVSIWESALTMTLPSGSTVPAAYAPLDEAGMDGDDAVSAQNNAEGQNNGLITMIKNDRWLAANRLRHLIGDWRHRTYKRAGFISGTTIDPRVDWTRGPESVDEQVGRMKNITILGTGTTEDDQDSIGTFNEGADTVNYSVPPPFLYPSTLAYTRKGRRLAKFHMVRPTSVRTHMTDLTSVVCVVRGRRLNVALLAQDTSSGYGTATEEISYHEKAYFQPLYNSTVMSKVPILSRGNLKDSDRQWCTPIRQAHTDADNTFTVRGRMPPQMGLFAGQGTVRPEGMISEVELNSVYLADEPLTADTLRAI